MHEELNNFTRNQVWDLVERPKNYNVIGTKWVFRNKQNKDGMVAVAGPGSQSWVFKISYDVKRFHSLKYIFIADNYN